MYPFFVSKDELRELLLAATCAFLKSPDGMTMIFEEAEKVRQELDIPQEGFMKAALA